MLGQQNNESVLTQLPKHSLLELGSKCNEPKEEDHFSPSK